MTDMIIVIRKLYFERLPLTLKSRCKINTNKDCVTLEADTETISGIAKCVEQFYSQEENMRNSLANTFWKWQSKALDYGDDDTDFNDFITWVNNQIDAMWKV